MKHIVFDNDETLVNFNDPFLAFVEHAHGIKVKRSDILHYDLTIALKVPLEVLQPMFHEFYASRFVHDIAPYPGMQQTLHTLKEQGYKLSILTARPSRYRDTVVSHIMHQFPDTFCADDIHVVGDEVHRVIPSKLERTRALESQIIIDDAQHHLLNAPTYQIKGILANWNHPCNKGADRSKFYAVADNIADLTDIILQPSR
ncbi:MAG TPA: HAD hydrolase-like protein [Acidobacteriota bacterium]|nr:HAD hydrolase-like protein [Acidobacteriota bacterium]